MGWRQDLKEAAESRGGLTKNELRQINKAYEKVDRSDIIGRAEDKGYNLTWRNKAAAAPAAPQSFTPSSTGSTYAESVSLFENMTRAQENLAHIQGGYSVQAAQVGSNASVAAAGLRADADKEVARAYADAQKYSSELGLQGVKYGADKEAAWREAVANLEVKGKLDLQPIINAGLERVSNIEAQASRDVAETTGKYSLESMKQRTAADKSIGKMQLAGSMYGLLGSVFG